MSSRTGFRTWSSSDLPLLPLYTTDLPRTMSPPPLIPPPVLPVPRSYSPSPSSSNRGRKSIQASQSLRPASQNPSTPIPLPYLYRRSAYLQATLQDLLDAQSEALLSGLSQASSSPIHDSSNDSATPTTSTSASVSASPRPGQSPRPGHKPSHSNNRHSSGVLGSSEITLRPKRVSLREARRRILRCMRELADVKNAEADELARYQDKLGEVVGQIDIWIGKKTGIERELKAVEEEEEARGREGWKALEVEEAQLRGEIEELEGKLVGMKRRLREVRGKMEERRNEFEAKIASYTVSSEIVEKSVKRFLAKPPTKLEPDWEKPSKQKEKENFISLPVSRRTIEMANDYYRSMHDRIASTIHAVTTERDALEAGSAVWKDVTIQISTFEKRLRSTITQLHSTQSSALIDTTDLSSSVTETMTALRNDEMKALLDEMDRTIDHVADQLGFMEENGWNLLVCCIGAELEALREGRGMLVSTLGLEEEEGKGNAHGEMGSVHEGLKDPLGVGDVSGTKPISQPLVPALEERSESEDEGPGPDLLYEREGEGR